jgi:hypothetical protein
MFSTTCPILSLLLRWSKAHRAQGRWNAKPMTGHVYTSATAWVVERKNACTHASHSRAKLQQSSRRLPLVFQSSALAVFPIYQIRTSLQYPQCLPTRRLTCTNSPIHLAPFSPAVRKPQSEQKCLLFYLTYRNDGTICISAKLQS